jgi:hypothetical protein
MCAFVCAYVVCVYTHTFKRAHMLTPHFSTDRFFLFFFNRRVHAPAVRTRQQRVLACSGTTAATVVPLPRTAG